ncbi:ABC transporter ATP-binding protein [Anaerosacchariphilus polymeriproducens]|uniref:ABC transporter ATP-binding protein n=1 Tax=Anaerosacchariphilus polymeriproducens TaxID=1812858 RepID=A0A371AUC0_9FIRM|nr:ABC transporter ATP-binding protein [Anaerosacchariphilus polymeriproducens]RDU23165.1 ABC transporter ATP-binding protein [Anaerosacchariphilus polymeriproducens]
MSKNRQSFGHGPGAMMQGEKAKNFKGTMAKLGKYLAKYKISILLIVIFSIGSTIFAIIGPKILGNATTELFNGVISKFSGGNGIDFGKLHHILLMVLLLYIISTLCSYVLGYFISTISQKLTYQLRKELSEKINRMPMIYFDKKTHGEVLSVITNDIDTLSQSLSQSAIQMITSILSVIGILIMMFSIDWIMTLIALLALPISMLLISIVVKKSQKHFKNQQIFLGNVNGQVEEIFSGHNIVKVFNGEQKAINEFEKSNEKLYDSAWKAQFLSGLMMPVMTFIGNLSYVAVAIIGGYFAIKGRITVGNIQSFISYTKSFTQPLAQIAQVSNMLQSTAAAAERVFEFLDEQEEVQTVENPKHISQIQGNVEFKNVKFGYNPENVIIHNFNGKIKQGQRIAIVGPTGAGKTTIVKLLMRFYDVNDGAILLDGNNIQDFNRGELRQLFGMVLQDTWLFNGSIMENIRYGNLDATDEQVIEAAKAAYVHHFVQTLPDGYHMELNEEANNVSQGQKQLLTIARAILADPKILILDEATSSVDTRTEIHIQKAMNNLMEGRTSFIIAHRLSTIRDADLILVMNNGDIIEQGNHKDLLERNGFYSQLYNSQFEQIETA